MIAFAWEIGISQKQKTAGSGSYLYNTKPNPYVCEPYVCYLRPGVVYIMIILRSLFMIIFIITSSAGAESNTFIMCFMYRNIHYNSNVWIALHYITICVCVCLFDIY